RWEGGKKFLDVPANLPRFYAPAKTAERLRQLAEVEVQVTGQMTWRVVRGRTIVGIIEGTEASLKDEAIFLNAHYDAMSPVPALAPGASQACSAAGLLEMVRTLSIQPPKRTVVVVFSDGHFLNLAGIRPFVPLLQVVAGKRGRDLKVWTSEEQVLIDRLDDFEIRMFVGLDLLANSDVLTVTKPAFPYRISLPVPPLLNRLMALTTEYEALSGRKILANGLKQDLSRQGIGTLPETVPFEASAVALSGCPTLLFTTLNDMRSHFDSPLDRVNEMTFDGLAKQMAFLQHLIPGLINDPELEPWAWSTDAFGMVQGEVMHYGHRSYLPDQPTRGALVRARLRNATLAGVRGDFWTVADDSGRFEIQGLETTKILYTKKVRIEAYGIDAETGVITDAPDWGVNGERRLPGRALKVLMDAPVEQVQVVTTQVAGLTLFELFDPRNLLTPERLEVIDAALEAEPPSFGACLTLTPPEMEIFGYNNRLGSHIGTTGVLFAKPGSSVKAVMSTGLYGLGRRLLLLNGSAEHSEGVGYSVYGESRLTETVFHVAQDIAYLNNSRIANLERHGVNNRRLSGFQARTEGLLKEARDAREAHQHRTFLDRSRQAWALAAAAYQDVSSTQSGVIQGALFLLAMLVPFAHFAERLIFGFPNLKEQVFGFFGFFLAGFFALRFLHPAFELSISPAVILLGFIILTLGLLVTSIGISRLNHELKDLASGRRGRERSDLQRSGTFSTSISVGLAHLRRRPLRTGLTCATLILLTFSVLSFTSIRSALRTNRIEVGADARYSGVLVRMPGWKTMEMTAYRSLADRFGSNRVAPRAWVSDANIATRYLVQQTDGSGLYSEITGIAGLSAKERDLVGVHEGLIVGRWLDEGEDDACLLPVEVAEALGIGASNLNAASVRVFGEVFRVVGLLEDEALDLPDLNGEPLTPLHPEAKSLAQIEANASRGGGAGQLPAFDHLSPNEVIVLPFEAVMRWEKAVMISVGIETDDVEGVLQELSETEDMNLYASLNGRRYLINTIGVASVSGLGDLVVPIGIAALIVLNTMLGAVYERTREIGTFNAVGLAPKHVSGLFMAEACAYAVVGGLLGYVLGQVAAQSIGRWGLLAGLELNYSSLSAVLSLGLVMAVVLLSALYPAQQAGKICTPGIERRWTPPRPQGDALLMQLPFTLVRFDALGMGAFLAEFWASHQEQSIGAGFYVESLQAKKEDSRVVLTLTAWLAPFDQGVMQDVILEMAPGEDRYYVIDVTLKRTAGDFETWSRVMRTFLDDLRKQFLVWRTLSQDDRAFYVEELEKWVGGEIAN
ncbi:MAG: FtsX-like permease family protein, partial [Candidatus Latescibacteria bacterium]|nr:FtsX-like permease family protein [Candidatus Latescibacterota bacterium]